MNQHVNESTKEYTDKPNEQNLGVSTLTHTVPTILMKTSEPGAIRKASEILRQGGLVAFPTETVYGLGGDAFRPDASREIYAAKGRPSDNPLIVHIADIRDTERLAAEIPEKARQMMEAFWPGPLTMIFRKKDCVPDETTGGLPTVAIRMPSHPDAARLIRESGVLIAAPSANTSGRPSPTTAQHVFHDLNGKIDMILDGGPVGIGIESTIVDFTGPVPTICRPGYITRKMMESVIGDVEIDPALIEPDPNAHPKAPGMKYTHYAPQGKLTIVESRENPQTVTENVIRKINELVQAHEEKGESTAVLTTKDLQSRYHCQNVILMGNRPDGETVAAHLYGALRECDSRHISYIYSESFNRDDLGGAIMNRLLKAAGHRVILV